jgi:hypothetical protein
MPLVYADTSALFAFFRKPEVPTSCMWQPRGACICSLAWTSSGPVTPSKGLWHLPRGWKVRRFELKTPPRTSRR